MTNSLLYQASLLYQKGMNKQAYELYVQALELQPQNMSILCQLGLIAMESGNDEQALQWFKQVIKYYPETSDGYFLCGRILQKQKNYSEAYQYLKKALNQDNHHTIHHQFADTCWHLNRYEEALKHYEILCLSGHPSAGIYYNLGLVYQKLNHISQAKASFHKAIKLSPPFTQAYETLLLIYIQEKAHHKIVALYQYLQSHQVSFNLNHRLTLAYSYLQLHQYSQALETYQELLQESPDLLEGIQFIGLAYYQSGQLEQAQKYYLKWLDLKPESPEALSSLGSISRDLGQGAQAIMYYEKALALFKIRSSPLNQRHSSYAHTLSNYFMSLRSSEDISELQLFKKIRFWNDHQSNPGPNSPKPEHTGALKIGYISQDFRQCSAATLILALLKNHNRERFQIVLYSDVLQPDLLTKHFQSLVPQFEDVSQLTDRELIAKIKQDKIDILVELSNPGIFSKLLASRPAPVQVSGICYTASSGRNHIDFRLSDPHLTPPTQISTSSEKVIYLKHIMGWTPPSFHMEITPLPAITNGYLTFGCGNYLYKIGEQVIQLWTQLLQTIPHSRLHLKNPSLTCQKVQKDLLKKFRAIDPERIIFSGKTSQKEHFRYYQSLDISLDPFPFTGGVSSCESLWMGIPLITLATGTRVGVSLLETLALPQWIARTPEEYINIARTHASKLNELNQVRQLLRKTLLQSSICNGRAYAENIEKAYDVMWKMTP